MVTLKQAKAGHYFYVMNLGRGPVTRQLYPKGVEYLLAMGVRPGDEIPTAHLRHLRKNQLTYTKGEQPRDHIEYLDSSDELYSAADKELNVFMADDFSGDLQLYVRYPLMPSEDLAKLEPYCGVSCVGSDRSVSFLAFDMHELSVQPQEDHYEVTSYGDWGGVSAQRWTCGAPGLAPDGDVFALRQAEWRRQSNGDRLTWGEPILIVRKSSAPCPCMEIQDGATQIGRLGSDWVVEQYNMPAKRNREMEQWFESHGIRVFHTSPKIVFLSVPDVIDDEQIPRFDGKVVVWINELNSYRESTVVLESVKGDAVASPLTLRNLSQATLLIPELSSGKYILRVTTDHRVVRKFSVGPSTGRIEFPNFLRLQIGGIAYCGSEASTKNELELASIEQVPVVEIASPRSVSWRWSGVEGLLTGTSEDLNFAAQCLSEDLEFLRTTPGSSATLVLEAGAFGTITVQVSGTHPTKIAKELLPEHYGDCRQDHIPKLRWLESVISRGRDPSGFHAQGDRQVSAMTLHREWIRRLSVRTDERGKVG